jgi:hypothetical protein
VIDTLIDKQDSFEIIRDKIAAILVTEVNSQMQLATDAGKDPDRWKLRVFTERSNPFEQFLNAQSDKSPIVNIWFDNSSFDPSSSNIYQRQKSESIFNIDCYGYGVSSDDGTGHKPGDREAALECHRAIRLVRNILMSAQYRYLELQGLVWQRWPQSVTVFQPQLDGRSIQQIVGSRLAFKVEFNEFSPQFTPETLDYVSVEVSRAEDGQIIINADYDYSAP